MIDLGFRDTEGLVASYVIPGEEGVTLVETGPTPCLPALRSGLEAAGVAADDVRRIFVTHIHLDHAGGLGAAAAAFPNATMYAHERGAAHLIDPTRLIASARRAWGASADPLWGTIAPVPAGRLVALRGGERFPVDGGELRAIYTPGHAQHHLAFLDSGLGAVLVGDAAGVRLEGAPRARPAVPPPDLDLEALFTSLDAMVALEPRWILYSHFGPATSAVAALHAYREEVVAWRDAALAAALSDPSVENVARALRQRETERAVAAGAQPLDLARGEMVSGYELAAQGLLRYLRVRGLVPEAPH
ncbi:MAG: MBL fold metallo-hydrolase [Thermoplasmata archaeon]|nr:MBL fold metallo-hydrolase [Thermoplasmata archaeon]